MLFRHLEARCGHWELLATVPGVPIIDHGVEFHLSGISAIDMVCQIGSAWVGLDGTARQ